MRSYVLPCLALAEYKSERDFKLNRQDTFKKGVSLKVLRVLGEDEVIVRGLVKTRQAIIVGGKAVPGGTVETTAFNPFILKTPTKGLVDGTRIAPSGQYKVIDTKTVNKRTYFVLEKVEATEKK